MYYLREIEEQIDEYRRQTAAVSFDQRELDIIEELQQAEGSGVRKYFATVLVQLGLKLDPEAALPYAVTREAA